ncbi:MAG: O-antigen ligase family protein, partial [Bdellovibrionales bacterium]
LYSSFKCASFLIPLILLSNIKIQDRVSALFSYASFWGGLVSVSLFGLTLVLAYAIHRYGEGAPEVTKLNRGYSYILMLLWPYMAWWGAEKKVHHSFRGRCVFGLLLCMLLISLVITHSRAAQVAAVASCFVFVLAWLFPRLTVAGIAGAAVLFMGWPFYARWLFTEHHGALALLPGSWAHRVEIWDYFSYRIQESPWLGWGMGSAGQLEWAVPHGAFYALVQNAAAHPHNAVVQLWSDLGIAGLFLYLFMVLGALRLVGRLASEFRPYALACLTFVLCLLLCAYNLWTDSLWASIALTMFTFALLNRRKLSQC